MSQNGWSFESMYNSVVETTREMSHSVGADGVGMPDHELYIEDEETLAIMTKVKARRIGTQELAYGAANLRSTAANTLSAQKRFYECTDAVKKCVVPNSNTFFFLPNVDVSRLMDYDVDPNKPISISELYGELAKECEAMYKGQVRPLKEDYKKWKLDYLYNQKQLQDRRFKEGLEDAKTQQYEIGMNSAHLSWKQLGERLREDSKQYLIRTEKMVLKSMQTSTIISSYLALSAAAHALATAKLCDVPVGDVALNDRIDAAVMDLATHAQKLNLEVHINDNA